MRVVIVEDEKLKRMTLVSALNKTGFQAEGFESPHLALQHFEKHGADAVVTDIRLPGMDGLHVLERVRALDPRTAVIVMTAYGTVESAVEAMKLGAHDYILKPFSSDRLLLILNKLRRMRQLEEENDALKQRLADRYSFHNLVGQSKVMQELYSQIEVIARTDCTVLIEGESGTGKELVANAIHHHSTRATNPFVKLSCAVLNESILESELFGHEMGAFTGAIREKKGRFELANDGTLFLDDVDDIPLAFQVKLLRVLQEKEFERVGGDKPIRVDVRVICATKVDLWKRVEDGLFREDLYYRLKVIPLRLAPLRERREDIPLLIEHCLRKAGHPELKFTPTAIETLTQLNWPGNVRQLENIIQRLAALATTETVSEEMLPDDIMNGKVRRPVLHFKDKESIALESMLDELEVQALQWALEKSAGNQTEAASLLCMKRTTLRDKLKKHGMA
jgi:DNA-binding NtrC family response regulator